ncbi:MAG: helix-turn-helix domain-containing protein, partial [Actinoplanes sp.]
MTSQNGGPRDARTRVRDAIRSELAEAAVAAFRADGFDATTVEAIAAQVGVSKRTFFRYFGSKEDAVLEPLEEL